jgi:hypothetical protein
MGEDCLRWGMKGTWSVFNKSHTSLAADLIARLGMNGTMVGTVWVPVPSRVEALWTNFNCHEG